MHCLQNCQESIGETFVRLFACLCHCSVVWKYSRRNHLKLSSNLVSSNPNNPEINHADKNRMANTCNAFVLPKNVFVKQKISFLTLKGLSKNTLLFFYVVFFFSSSKWKINSSLNLDFFAISFPMNIDIKTFQCGRQLNFFVFSWQ